MLILTLSFLSGLQVAADSRPGENQIRGSQAIWQWGSQLRMWLQGLDFISVDLWNL